MQTMQYFFYYNGEIYRRSNVLPLLEVAREYCTEYGYNSYEEAQTVVSECQDLLAKNTLKLDDITFYAAEKLLDDILILPSNNIFISNLLQRYS